MSSKLKPESAIALRVGVSPGVSLLGGAGTGVADIGALPVQSPSVLASTLSTSGGRMMGVLSLFGGGPKSTVWPERSIVAYRLNSTNVPVGRWNGGLFSSPL